MAKRERAQERITAEEVPAAQVPSFVLRADSKGHIRALMAALQELPDEAMEGLQKLREFELYEEAHR